MERFLANLIQKRVLICVVFSLCLFGGFLAFQSLPIDAFPDLSNVQVEILTESPGMAPLETEQLVTIPIESIMNGLPRVNQVRSLSKFGLSVITVVFDDGMDTYFARQLVNERLQIAKSRLPQGLDPEMGPITTGMGEIYQYMITGTGYSPTELKTLHDWDIKYQLRTVPGVNEVNSWGGQTQEYQVVVSPEQLLQFKLTLPEVFQALSNNNANFSGGIIQHGPQQYILRGVGRIQRLNDIANIIVKYQNGTPVYIRNIGRVEFGNALRQGAVTKDGQGEIVAGIVMMLKGENSRAVIQRVKAKIQEIRKGLPEGTYLTPFYDQTHLVEQTLHTVQSNLLEGGTLVVVVLLMLLGNIRAALIVAATIPLSLMFSFMGMRALGITANIMSLGAVDFGMIVDGSIVMVENILRKLSHTPYQSSQNRFVLIQEAVQEMARPIFFGVLIITVVYMPVLSLQGIEYKMFSPMVFTVCFALLGSLAIALTLVPVLCSFFLQKQITEKESFFIQSLRKPYLHLLQQALRYRKCTVALALGAFVITLASVPFLGTEFVPELDEGDYVVKALNLPSISLPEALQISTRIEKSILQSPEVITVVSKTGRPDLATDPMGVYQTDAYVKLKPKSQWRVGLSKEKLTEELQQRLSHDVPETNFSFTQPISERVNELISGVRSDLAIKIFGPDLETLVQKAEAFQQVLETVPGQADLQVEQLTGTGQLLVVPDRSKMARYGVNMSDIRTLIETSAIGTPVSEIVEGIKRFTLRVKFPEGTDMNPLTVQNLLIETAGGQRVPLNQVATVQEGEGLESVNREAGQRRIIVQCNIRGRDMGSFVKEAQAKIDQTVKLPSGYHVTWGGQFENQQRAMTRLMIVIPFSILIIFLLLIATFSQIKPALLVLLNVPFALIGGVVALWVRGMYLSVPASVGFIALFGVAILNGLVLISTINKLRAEGIELETAIVHGAETRLRPVLMTALVATLGFLPMSLSQGSGAEVQKPLATVVIGGLMTSTLLTLLVLPAIYSWVNQKHAADS